MAVKLENRTESSAEFINTMLIICDYLEKKLWNNLIKRNIKYDDAIKIKDLVGVELIFKLRLSQLALDIYDDIQRINYYFLTGKISDEKFEENYKERAKLEDKVIRELKVLKHDFSAMIYTFSSQFKNKDCVEYFSTLIAKETILIKGLKKSDDLLYSERNYKR